MAWGSLSGMEVTLYAALVTATVLAYLRALETGSPWWGLLAGLAGSARPEAFIVFPILALDWTARVVRGLLPGQRLRAVHSPMLLFAAPTAVFVALNMHASGHPLPLTFYAKTYGMGTVPSLMEGRWHDALVAAGWYPVEFVYQLLTWCESEYPDLALGALVGAFALVGATGNATTRGEAPTCSLRFSSPRRSSRDWSRPSRRCWSTMAGISFTCWRSSWWSL